MKVLLVHDFFQQHGGENAVALADKELLLGHGEQVTSYTRHNDEIKDYNLWRKLAFPSNTIYSARTRKELTEIVEKDRPDVVYIHNVFPLISPSIYHHLHALEIPCAQVMHDFRFMCPNGWFYTQGNICERCSSGNYLNAIRYRCYRDSYVLSSLYSASIGLNRLAGVLKKISAFICLTEFMKLKLLKIGIPEEKLFVRPNFIDTTQISPAYKPGGYVLYLGRLSAEKGLWTLIHAFEQLDTMRLKIVGTGPLENTLKKYVQDKGLKHIEFPGFKDGNEKWDLLRNSLFMVVPSIWYETFGLVVLEAYAASKAVLASDIGGLPYIVKNGKSGMLFQPGSVADLTDKIRYMMKRSDEVETMGRYGRQLAETEYGPAQAYSTLMNIFDKLPK